MKPTPRQYAAALHQAISSSQTADLDKILDNFMSLLKENGDLTQAGVIEEEFYAYDRESRGIVTAAVTSAKNLDPKSERKIIEELNRYLSGQVELKKQIDESMVGGVMVRVGDELIDGSVKRSIKDLKDTLSK